MQTFLYPNSLPSKEPYTTWALTGEEPTELLLPYPPEKRPFNFPKYTPVSLRYMTMVSWMALHAYWAWCVGKPLVSHQDFNFVGRCVQQAEVNDASLQSHIYPLEPHCPNSWSPCRQPNYSFVPSRYPRWIRDVMEVVPLSPVCPWTDQRADPNRFYTGMSNTK